MAEKPSFNMSKVSPADKLILGGAGVYFIWSFLKVWYGYNGPGSQFLGTLGVSGKISGWHGPTGFAVILAIIALVWAGLRAGGVAMNIGVKAGLIDLILGGLALLLTLLGLVSQPAFFGPSWGLFVGIILAAVWTYGAWMKYSEPGTTASTPPTGTGGFTS